jgi:hypothetical protein
MKNETPKDSKSNRKMYTPPTLTKVGKLSRLTHKTGSQNDALTNTTSFSM